MTPPAVKGMLFIIMSFASPSLPEERGDVFFRTRKYAAAVAANEQHSDKVTAAAAAVAPPPRTSSAPPTPAADLSTCVSSSEAAVRVNFLLPSSQPLKTLLSPQKTTPGAITR